MITARLALFAFTSTIFGGQCGQAAHQHPAGPPAVVADPHAGHASGSAMPSGYAAVTLDPAKAKSLGFSSVKAEHRSFDKVVRTVAVVTLDETRTAHVHAKVRGFVESVQVDFIGKKVSAGAPLCAIYSQGVYAAELEYVALLKSAPTPAPEPMTAGVESKAWTSLLEAARRRLLLWDVPKAQIDQLENTLIAARTFTLSAPRTGIVIAKQAFVGNYVESGTEMYVISDLAKLWAVVDVYEADLAFVHLGDEVKLTVEGLADPIVAKVAFLSPTINEATRTLKVRIDLDNADGRLRPGAFATAEIKLAMGHGLAIPETAVIHTGERNIVFVAHGTLGSDIVPREVTLGPLVGGFYRVDSGIEDGELVATGAQFLVDSESRLQATSGAGGGHAGHAGH